MTALFSLGHLVSTPGALDFAERYNIDLLKLVARHTNGDWGDLCAEDLKRNDEALTDGSRIFSSYNIGKNKIWIITEADRASTCVLLPAEY